MLRTKQLDRVVYVLVAVVVVSVGYVLVLAILAPEQLAEATILATDLICSGCVETSDIADNAVTSAKIGGSQVGNGDIASSAVTSSKISDTNGVSSVDIVNGEVTSTDIRDGTITSTDIAPGTIPSGGGIPPDNSVTSEKIVDDAVNSVDIGDAEITAQDIAEGTIRGGNIKDNTIQDADIAPGAIATIVVDKTETVSLGAGQEKQVFAVCPDGYVATGGGYVILNGDLRIWNNAPGGHPTGAPLDNWWVTFSNLNPSINPVSILVYVVCA